MRIFCASFSARLPGTVSYNHHTSLSSGQLCEKLKRARVAKKFGNERFREARQQYFSSHLFNLR